MEELTTDEKITIEIEHAEAAIVKQKQLVDDYATVVKHLANVNAVMNAELLKLYVGKLEQAIRQLQTNEDTLDLLVYISGTQKGDCNGKEDSGTN